MPARDAPAVCCWRSTIWRWTGCRGASWCRTWRRPGRRLRAGRDAVAAAARHLVPALGAAACGARAGRRRGWTSFRSGRGMLSAPALSLVDGRARSAAATSPARAGQLTLTLPAAVTGALLTRVPAAFHGGINDVLLTGLALAVADWCRRRGRGAASSHAVLIDLEGHGREEVFADVDLSRTVGWFTSLFPVRLDAGCARSRRGAGGRAGARARAQARSRSSCGRCRTTGSAMGCCAISTARPASQLARLCGAADRLQLSGAVRGRPASARTGRRRRRRWRSAAAAIRRCRWRTRSRSMRSRSMARRAPSCSATWSWAPALLVGGRGARPGADAGSRRWRRWCAMPTQPGAGGRTPSDLPLVALSQGEIERLERRYPRIEDILPLSPLQEGLLFHALYDAQAPDVYTVQLVLGLQGRARRRGAAGGRAGAVERHASLRAGFRHEGLSRPVQVIVPRRDGALAHASTCRCWMRRSASSGWPASWRRTAPSASISRSPPLLRFALIRLSADAAPAGADQPSHPDGRLVDAGAGAGAARRSMRSSGRCAARCRG